MTTPDEEVISTENSLEMLRRPHLWPAAQMPRQIWVKRNRVGGQQTGPCILWGKDPDQYIIIMHDWANGGERKTLTYASPEEIDADGWEVD